MISPVPTLPEVLTVDEAAAYLRVDRKTLYAAIKAGEAPGRTIGRRIVIHRDTLLAWLSSTVHALPGKGGRHGSASRSH